ncbi:hypothetical protein SDC9_163801 [bioreactor metagenome]|uniref:Uncharacterized protein n=1 Tax=bioreactor metagenome TaxID=1076179 RepID=A0A645FPV4_9ZZZZ
MLENEFIREIKKDSGLLYHLTVSKRDIPDVYSILLNAKLSKT